MYRVIVTNGGEETLAHGAHFGDPKLLSGSIKDEINLASNFTFSMLPNNPAYKKASPLKTLIRVENAITGAIDFDGYILTPAESMDDSGAFGKSYTAVSELAYLTHSSQRHGEYHDITVRDFLQVMLDNHNADVADDPIDKQFKLGKVDVDSSTGTLYRYLGYEDTLSSIKDKLLGRLGGELRVRKEGGIRYLDYLKEAGERSDTKIKLATNLQAINKEIDVTDLVTRLIPLGSRIESEEDDATDASEARITIESVNDGKDYIVDTETEAAIGTVIVKSETWDNVNDPETLITRGLEYMQQQNRVRVQHSINALDLSILGKAPSAFKAGNWHDVYNPVMGMDEEMRIIAKTTDILEPEKNSLTIGDKLKTAAQQQADANKQMRLVNELENRVDALKSTNNNLSASLIAAKSELDGIQDRLKNIDLSELPDELQGIAQQLVSLQGSISDIEAEISARPIYKPASSTVDGLLSANLYTKLMAIDLATEEKQGLITKEDKAKLNKISVTDPIDLDDLNDRITALENMQGAGN